MRTGGKTMKKWKVKSSKGDYKFYGTPKQIVLQMARDDFLVNSKWDYMQEVRERLIMIFDIKINIIEKDFEGFLEQLEKHELISIER